MANSPVLELQREAGAKVGEVYGWHLPLAYSSLAEEYGAATQGVGLVERSYVGRLKLTGTDGPDLLNRLTTNKLELLAVGQGMYTVLTSSKGRILDLLFVLRLDGHLLALTGPENRKKVADWIDFYTFSEDVKIQDVTEETAMLGVVGPRAADLLGDLAGQPMTSLPRYGSASARVGDIDALAMRTDFLGLPGYDLVVEAPEAPRLWSALLKLGAPRGLRPVGMEAAEVVRVEQGVPVYGKELSEDANPLEANLLEFISFNKGCYVGQEVVTRLNTYKKVQRHLVGLSWDWAGPPASDASLSFQGRQVGRITSAVRSVRLEKGMGLGYVRNEQAQPGVLLAMQSASGATAVQVESLPLKP